MRYKTNVKIIIDKRKLETLKRLNCPIEILIDLIFDGVLNLTGDSLIDDNLESLIEEKEFKNWGGNHNPKGNNQYSLGQVDHQVERGQVIGQVGDKDKDKDKDKDYSTNKTVVKLNNSTLYLNEKEKENLTKEKESLQDWRGEYSNVHLNKAQYGKLLVLIGKKEKLNELIEQLSENIACKRANAPPFDEGFPDMHFVILKKYWDFQRLKCDKQRTLEESQNDFKAQIKALAEKCREEEREDLRSG